jgi:hypothetical protein
MQVSDYSSDNDTTSILPEEPLFKSLAPEAAEQQDYIFPIESIQKKSKLPWSKRIFSKSKKQKSSSVMILNNNSNNNNDDDDEKVDDTISIDQVRQNHSKFNLSSLFFRKQNINVLKKNKSAVNLSTPAKDASPFTSTETLMSTYYNKGANDTSKATAETKGPNNFSNNRLPIHKERAIYKQSHLKLTHPRRPLHDQVMISNLMFWYLSIINHSNNSSLFCENASLARKTYGIPIAGANRRGTRRKNSNQIRHQSKNPASIPQRVGSKTHPKSRHHQRTKYTSLGSDESDDSDDDDDDSSSDEEDLDGAEKVHNHKYRNHANIQNHSTRLQHHQKPHRTATHIKSQDSSEEEDDVPLAMYKPKRS